MRIYFYLESLEGIMKTVPRRPSPSPTDAGKRRLDSVYFVGGEPRKIRPPETLSLAPRAQTTDSLWT